MDRKTSRVSRATVTRPSVSSYACRVKHARKELWFEVPERRAYLNITPQVEEFVRESGIEHGLCLVNPMHITAAVYVNDDERGLIQDYDDWLERLAPHEPVSQ